MCSLQTKWTNINSLWIPYITLWYRTIYIYLCKYDIIIWKQKYWKVLDLAIIIVNLCIYLRIITDRIFYFCPFLAHATDYYGKSLFRQDAFCRLPPNTTSLWSCRLTRCRLYISPHLGLVLYIFSLGYPYYHASRYFLLTLLGTVFRLLDKYPEMSWTCYHYLSISFYQGIWGV